MSLRSLLPCAFTALFALHSAALADNHIFFNGAPMLSVKRQGVFESFELVERNGIDKPQVTPATRRAIKTLYAPGQTHGSTVQGFALDPGVGCTEPDRVILSDSLSTDGVLSTKPLHLPRYPGTQSVSPDQSRRVLSALNSILQKEKGLSRQNRSMLRTQAAIKSAMLDKSGATSFIIEAEIEANSRTTISLLLILTPRASGHLYATYSEIRKGGPSDSDGYAGQQSFVDHIDLDSDGQDEIFVSEMGYESGGIKVFTRRGQSWEQIADGAATGC